MNDNFYIVIHSAGSGEELARLNSEDLLTVAETHGTSVRTLKQVLAERMQLSRFRQRLLNQDTGELLQDDMILSPPTNIQLVKLEFLPPNHRREEEFMDACACGRSDEVEHILQGPQDPNDPHLTFDEYVGYIDDGYMPLHVAAQEGNVEVVRLLLEAGADTEKRADDGVTPLHVAASRGNRDVARLLLQWGAEKEKLTQHCGVTPLHAAAASGNLEVVRLLLEWGADIEKNAATGSTPLHWASGNGRLETVRFLLELGAEKETIEGDDSRTALHWASDYGHLEVVRLLLESGANKEKLTKSGFSAMDLAARHGDHEVVCLLQSF